MHMCRDLWFGRAGLDRARGKGERNAHDLGVLDIEQFAILARLIGQPAQASANYLLAQKLGAKGADPENVGDGVGVPALGQHRHRDDATDLLAEASLAPDRVHDLAQ